MSLARLDQDLRERYADPVAGARALERARHELRVRREADDGGPVARSHVGRALQRLSEQCRLAGLLEESLEHKDAAIQMWLELGKHRAQFLVRLQRALVLAELGRREAEDIMTELSEELDADERLRPFYQDFLLEYDARRCYWEGDREQACARLETALALRREHRTTRIVEWTEQALRLISCGSEKV